MVWPVAWWGPQDLAQKEFTFSHDRFSSILSPSFFSFDHHLNVSFFLPSFLRSAAAPSESRPHNHHHFASSLFSHSCRESLAKLQPTVTATPEDILLELRVQQFSHNYTTVHTDKQRTLLHARRLALSCLFCAPSTSFSSSSSSSVSSPSDFSPSVRASRSLSRSHSHFGGTAECEGDLELKSKWSSRQLRIRLFPHRNKHVENNYYDCGRNTVQRGASEEGGWGHWVDHQNISEERDILFSVRIIEYAANLATLWFSQPSSSSPGVARRYAASSVSYKVSLIVFSFAGHTRLHRYK